MSLHRSLCGLHLLCRPLIAAYILALWLGGPAAGQRTEANLSGGGWNLWLDKTAVWDQDTLYLPPVEIKSVPVNPPTGGWEALSAKNALSVSVPGTVEEYLWDTISAENKSIRRNLTDGNYQGVSWWWRDVALPREAVGKRVNLHFESVRQRAEIFLNGQLVGYDIIGNTPFDVDITDKCRIGESNRLAVRITDPGGNFSWEDVGSQEWGKQGIPPSHGFGGITGPVKLVIADPVHVADIFVKNKPMITDIDIEVTATNSSKAPVQADVQILIEEARTRKIVKSETIRSILLKPGETVLPRSVSVPNGKPWDLEHPNLYLCESRISMNGRLRDSKQERFGFRWFSLDGIGKDAVLRLNGKRTVLRSAISWGFWPTNGIFPTEELAKRQVESAKALGLNMLNFHRCIGNRLCLDKADEMGLLYFEEPGGYSCENGDEFALACAREKLLRMVKRDRNHPSLIIYNMINETITPPTEKNKRDMADAHKLDPTRLIVYTSAWANQGKEGEDPIKLHMRPYDDKQYMWGWYDFHNAGGPGVYRDAFYRSPKDYYLYTQRKDEIVFWGEQGAIASPPRLARIHEALTETGRNGWDGKAYEELYQAYEKALDEKGLRKYFPTVDTLTLSIGSIPYYYQGRMIENMRLGNVADGYVTNGWEAELLETHSGIVDCWRNPKGDASILARYNRPVYVAVKVRNKVVQVPKTIVADFHIINEVNLKGSYKLKAWLLDPNGRRVWEEEWPVKVSGGDVYGELLVGDVKAEIPSLPGRYTMEARLLDASGHVKADGSDEIFAVDWSSTPVPRNGAVLEQGNSLQTFLEKRKRVRLPGYSNGPGKLDYVLIRDVDEEAKTVVPAGAFTIDGSKPGLSVEFFTDWAMKNKVTSQVDGSIDFDFTGKEPVPGMPKENFSAGWTGRITVPETGDYTFRTLSDDGARLWIDGKLLIDNGGPHGPTLDSSERIALQAGKTYDIRLDYFQAGGPAVIRLYWTLPSMTNVTDALVRSVLDRVKTDGTTAVFVSGTERWARFMSKLGIIPYDGKMDVWNVWVGGNLFVRDHPLFKGLPINQGMNWEYQDLVNYETLRYGLMLKGEETVVCTVNYNEPRIGTAVGIVNYGKGKILLSTLDLRSLDTDSPGADVVRKVFCNCLEFAGKGGGNAE